MAVVRPLCSFREVCASPSGMKHMGALLLSPQPSSKLSRLIELAAHVAVIVDGERKGEAAVVDEVVVPFLYAHGACLDVCTAVDRQQLFGVAGSVSSPRALSRGISRVISC